MANIREWMAALSSAKAAGPPQWQAAPPLRVCLKHGKNLVVTRKEVQSMDNGPKITAKALDWHALAAIFEAF